jgi:hypothetical protein
MTTEPDTDLSASEPIGIVKWSEEWWANAKPEVQAHRCTAHRKNGDRCKRAACSGGRVCTHHGGAAKQCVRAARVRLQNAADKMARELLGMATDPNVSDSVKLAAIRDALDRAGLKPVTAVDIEVSTKPWESVMEGISGLVSARELALESGHDSLDDDPDSSSSMDSFEFPDEIDPESDEIDAEVIEVVEDPGYTDSAGTAYPPEDDSAGSVELSRRNLGPLGPNGPVNSGLLSLSDAVEAVSEMRQREAARTREMRRR